MSAIPLRILVTGTTGQIGGEILSLLSPSATIFAPSRTDLDLADESSIRRYVQRTQPQWIVNTAAYTAVDKAETEPGVAHAINGEAPRIFGEEARKLHASVIHFSTDYVFDGTSPRPYVETDATAPINVYGQTKLAGEWGLAESGARHLILRTSWVYGATGKNFLLSILRMASERATSGDPLRVVADQHGAPTWSHDLARLTAHILATRPELSEVGGTYHATASGETTWHGFAESALNLVTQSNPSATFAPLSPIASAEYPTVARRPANSRLNCNKLAEKIHFTFPHWSASLAKVAATLCHV